MIKQKMMKIIENTRRKARKQYQNEMREAIIQSNTLQSYAQTLHSMLLHQKIKLYDVHQILTQINSILLSSQYLNITQVSIKAISRQCFFALNWFNKYIQNLELEFDENLNEILFQQKQLQETQRVLTSIVCILSWKCKQISQIEQHLFMMIDQLKFISVSKTVEELPLRCLNALMHLLDSEISHGAFYALISSNFQTQVISWLVNDIELNINIAYLPAIIRLIDGFLRIRRHINDQNHQNIGKIKHFDQVLADFVIKQFKNKSQINIIEEYCLIQIQSSLCSLLRISSQLQISRQKQERISKLCLPLLSVQYPQLILMYLYHLFWIIHQYKIQFNFFEMEQFSYLISLHIDIPLHSFDQFKDGIALVIINFVLNSKNAEGTAKKIYKQIQREGLMLMEVVENQSQEMKQFHQIMSKFDLDDDE